MADTTPNPDDLKIQLQNLMAGGPAPVYFNGFTLNTSATDVAINLQLGNRKVSSLIGSYSVAKSLQEQLSKAIQDFERLSKTQVSSIDELAAKMRLDGGGGNENSN